MMGVEAVKLEILTTIHSLKPYIRYQGGKTRARIPKKIDV